MIKIAQHMKNMPIVYCNRMFSVISEKKCKKAMGDDTITLLPNVTTNASKNIAC